MDTRDPKIVAKNWGALCHILGLCGLAFPLGSILGPLTVWLARRDTMESVDREGRLALNFQMSVALYFGVSFAIWYGPSSNAFLPSILVWAAIWAPFWLILTMRAIFTYFRNGVARYPLALTLLKTPPKSIP